jgi:hypothetical protein
MHKQLSVLGFLFILGCATEEKLPTTAFFGGQIINPSSEFVSMYKYDERIDSLPLDKENRFAKHYDSIHFGLFKMEHLPEKQMVIIEPGDSIWSRANMSDFNASLVFSGSGSGKNNFLIDTYRNISQEVGYLSSKYVLDARAFRQIIDSLQVEKKDAWANFSEQSQLTPLAQKITQAAYVYPYANRRERYALIRGKTATNKDSTFFNFRKFLNYGERDLVYFEPYIAYMMSYLSQEALEEGQLFVQEKNRTEFNIKRIQLIDDRISNPVLRSVLARTVAYEELLNFRNHAYHENFLQFFINVNTSPNYLNEILSLHASLIQMEPGQQLPVVEIETNTGNIVASNEAFSGQRTVVYFWSQTQMNHFKRTQERVKTYQERFPNYRFVGVCIQPYNDLVRNYQSIMKIPPENQFALVNFERASSEWVITLLNKGIIIDENGRILDGFGNFSSSTFVETLKQNAP